VGKCRLDSCDSIGISGSSCEHDNEPLGSGKGEFFD
jgi:hypothetical protein